MKLEQFKKGDVVTRVKMTKDYSYVGIGQKMEFLGILNGCVYFRMEKTIIFYVVYEMYNDDCWEFYIDPMTLLEDDKEEDIQSKIDKAIEREDYELASTLKKQLK